MKKIIFLATFLLTIFVACDDDSDSLNYEEQLAADIQKIEDYLEQNNLTAESLESGLHYIIEEQGTGNYPTEDSTIIISYAGLFLNEDTFDAGDSIEMVLGNTILGWRKGIPMFKEGGKGQLFIPSSMGYGIYGEGSIPGNTVLHFDIDLIEVSSD
jgi:FKBP-type peptidyl-prolyl cis-trans isomerase FkpA